MNNAGICVLQVLRQSVHSIYVAFSDSQIVGEVQALQSLGDVRELSPEEMKERNEGDMSLKRKREAASDRLEKLPMSFLESVMSLRGEGGSSRSRQGRVRGQNAVVVLCLRSALIRICCTAMAASGQRVKGGRRNGR